MSVFNIQLPGNFDTNDTQAVKKIASYLYALNEQLKYMFGNMEPEDNFTGQALSKYIQVGEDVATLNFDVNGLKVTVVRKGEVVSAINMSPEEIKIMASKISLEGLVTANGYFKIFLDGSMQAINGRFLGDITGSRIDGSQFNGGEIIVGCLMADNREAQIGNWVFSNSNRSVFRDFNDMIGMSTDPGDSSGLWMWVGWYSSRDYIMACNDNGVYCGRNLIVLNDAEVNGNIDCDTIYSSAAGESWSDRRLKKNIHRLPLPLMKKLIMKLKPVSYNMKKDGRPGVGFVAQDVIRACKKLGIDLPLYGRHPKGKYYTIPYQNYIAPLISVVQDQEREIEELKKQIGQSGKDGKSWQ